ncbi:MAG: lysine--tRNA ligase [Bifidobacteriaceae bacterium]|jgi:lysyl-tRNA synthetase class 2|nr:lysine--tRNA ligase [Bifidobacteriaceae bacterium]
MVKANQTSREKTVNSDVEKTSQVESKTASNQTSNQVSEAEQIRIRKQKRQKLIDLGLQAYPLDLKATDSIDSIRQKYYYLKTDEQTNEVVSMIGRVMFLRGAGKLSFVALQDGRGNRLQAMFSLAEIGEQTMKYFRELVDIGDHLWVKGEVISSKTGELSVLVSSWKMASKALRPLPVLHKNLSDDLKARQRYLDFLINSKARDVVIHRSEIIAALRQSLIQDDFMEIETPMLQTLHGGAAARPFITKMNAFDIDLYLRIAPELFLKRAVVGGFDRVFEINRNFRNEGMDSSHLPEFSMLELYQSYSDYKDIAKLTQKLIQTVCQSVFASQSIILPNGEMYDFSGNWDEISLYESLSKALGESITPATPKDRLITIAKTKLEPSAKKQLNDTKEIKKLISGKLVELLWEQLVCPSLVRPTFVYDFPADNSPLVSSHRTKSGLVEKWDLYIRGFELATGYSELVDPVIQKQRFEAQVKLAKQGDDEAMKMDNDFIEALEYGMPPTAGMGMGIDRLVMAFTGLGLRDTIAFPLVKPVN